MIVILLIEIVAVTSVSEWFQHKGIGREVRSWYTSNLSCAVCTVLLGSSTVRKSSPAFQTSKSLADASKIAGEIPTEKPENDRVKRWIQISCSLMCPLTLWIWADEWSATIPEWESSCAPKYLKYYFGFQGNSSVWRRTVTAEIPASGARISSRS